MTQTQDWFAGIGGFRFPLEACGRKCVLSSEINPHCRHDIHYKNGGGLKASPVGDKKKEKLTPFLNIIFYVQVFSVNLLVLQAKKRIKGSTR